MANRLLTTREVVDGMMLSARVQADKIPIRSCEKVAEGPFTGGMGIGGALGVAFILACMERVNREEFAGYGSD